MPITSTSTYSVLTLTHSHSVVGRIALAVQAIPPIPTHFSVARSFICHIRAPSINSSMSLNDIWQLHWWGPMTHCVRWGPWPTVEGAIWGSNRQPKHAIANCCCHLANTKKVILPTANYFGSWCLTNRFFQNYLSEVKLARSSKINSQELLHENFYRPVTQTTSLKH